MTSVSIGTRQFSTKAKAEEHCRAIRAKYQPPPANTPVTDPDDIAFLHDLLALHPDAADKIGPGVERFEVRHYDYGTRGFCAVRTDGSPIDFSSKWIIQHAA